MKLYSIHADVYGRCKQGKYYYANKTTLRHMDYPFFPNNYKSTYLNNNRLVATAEEEGLHIDEGSVWPDFLLVGSFIPPFVVSENVLKFFKENNWDIESATELRVVAASPGCKISSSPPRYFAITTLPGIVRIFENRRSKYLADTHNGLPLFSSYFEGQESSSKVGILVTEDVKLAIKKSGLTNAVFKELIVY